jgi:hypothetical protein
MADDSSTSFHPHMIPEATGFYRIFLYRTAEEGLLRTREGQQIFW